MKLIDITVTRVIPAPDETVFDVWMDSNSPGRPWFGAEHVILNPIVDGLFYFAVKHEGRTWPHYGRFVTLRHSGAPDDELGRQHNEGWTWVLSMLAERFASRPQTQAT